MSNLEIDLMGKIVLPIIMTITLALALALFCAIAFHVYNDKNEAETYTLNKDEWVCTKSHKEKRDTSSVIIIGSQVIPQSSSYMETVCDCWERKQNSADAQKCEVK